MKKIMIFLCVLLLTGCFGEESRGHLTNRCVKVIETENLKDETIYEIKFIQDIIENIKIIHNYEGDKTTIDSIKQSHESQVRFYERNNVRVESTNNDIYTITYNIDMSMLTNEIREKHNLLEERSKLVLSLEKDGYKCE